MTWRNLIKGEGSGVTPEFAILIAAIIAVLSGTGWLWYVAFSQIK